MSRTPEEQILWGVLRNTSIGSLDRERLTCAIEKALNAAYEQAAESDVYQQAARSHGKTSAAALALYNSIDRGIESFLFHDSKGGIQVWRRIREEEE